MKKEMKAVVLAAGRGTRLRTEGFDVPKVMRQAAGRPLLYYVLRSLDFIPPEDTIIVVGYQK
jgi:choline kinase